MRQIRRPTAYEPPVGYGWRSRLAWYVMHLGCRHPKGTICQHRHYEYDIWLAGLGSGYSSGVAYERSHRP